MHRNHGSEPGGWWRRAAWARVVLLAVVVGGALLLLHGRIDLTAVHATAERLNGGVAFALLVVLPLVGFPASVLHVAAGIRFGAIVGQLLVSLSIALQLVASYAIAWRWRDALAGRFPRLRQRIPHGAHAGIAVFAVLLPGAPYAAVNYVLPLLGLRFRTYFFCLWPLHTLRSTVTVLLGDQSDKFTPMRLALLGAYALLLAGVSWWLFRRLRRQLGDPPAAADDRMQPA